MKKLIAVAAIALTSLAATAAPSFADSVRVIIGTPGYHDDYRPSYRHGPPPRYWRDRQYSSYQRCWKEPYQVRSHHHEITKYKTVCRR